MRIRHAVLFALALVLVGPAAAWADVTAFIGVNGSPSTRLVKGAAIGATLLVVGLEFEYAQTSEDPTEHSPGLQTGSGNVLVQTPLSVMGLQFYATAGGGLYRETLGTTSETNVATNAGGGVKVSLVGPLKLRVDYRVFKLAGQPTTSVAHRFYTGATIGF